MKPCPFCGERARLQANGLVVHLVTATWCPLSYLTFLEKDWQTRMLEIDPALKSKLEAFEELRKDVERILGRIGEVIEWEFREGNTYHHITATKLKELHDSLLIKWGRI